MLVQSKEELRSAIASGAELVEVTDPGLIRYLRRRRTFFRSLGHIGLILALISAFSVLQPLLNSDSSTPDIMASTLLPDQKQFSPELNLLKTEVTSWNDLVSFFTQHSLALTAVLIFSGLARLFLRQAAKDKITLSRDPLKLTIEPNKGQVLYLKPKSNIS